MNELMKSLYDLAVQYMVDETELSEEIIDDILMELRCMRKFRPLTDDNFDIVSKQLKSDFSISLKEGTLIEETRHQKWFMNRKASLPMKYWERYKKYLLGDKGFAPTVVNSMDSILDTLTDLLGDPERDIKYSRKGLIIGDVQSGKTANYLGLICKAVDTGYKVVVLMTGVIERLRKQTQERVDEGFVGTYSDAIMTKSGGEPITIGVGNYDPSIRPMVLTSVTDDFKTANAKNLGFDLRNINGPVIFVVKKNVSVLKRLNQWLNTFNPTTGNEIDQSILVIDDEADNASINVNDPDKSPTAINSQIRILLTSFTKSSYVGFTATPYANIFIDPDSIDEMIGENLFPKDYIYSLNSPTNYTGARNIFSKDGNARYVLQTIDTDPNHEDSIENIIPLKHKSTIQIDRLPSDLKNAIEAFALANAIEDMMGLKGNHRSMLINVSRCNPVQEKLFTVVNDYVKEMQAAFKDYCCLDPQIALKNNYIKATRDTYNKLYSDYVDYSWEEIQKNLYSSFAPVEVCVVNQRHREELNYEDAKDGLRAIAIGGLSLSRGLTLEGLVISYFYRNSRMYDTLMQMGRWFGYRGKYAHLCRLWMSSESIDWYEQISEATDELRAEIKRYEDTGLTPLDFGIRVRSDLTSLIVTARNKMRTAEKMECAISLSEVSIETPELYSDVGKNKDNLEAVKRLVDQLYINGFEIESNNEHFGVKNVPSSYITELLGFIDVSPKNERFNTETLVQFIKKYKGNELKKWDISFASGKSELPIDLGHGIVYKHSTRSYSIENDMKILKMSGSKRRLGTNADSAYGLNTDTINILKERKSGKSLISNDYFKDVERNPLLVIYVVSLLDAINADPDEETKIKEMYNNNVLIGFSIGIPKLSDSETKFAKYVYNKVALQKMFEGEEDISDEEEE